MSLKDWKLLSKICVAIFILQFVYAFLFLDGGFVFDKELLNWLIPFNILLMNPMLIADIKMRNSKDKTDRYYSTPSSSLFLLIALDLFALRVLVDGF